MIHEESQTRKLFGADSSMGLFVSLYLLLLAFFIILNVMSNQANTKAEAVMDSVSHTFSGTALPKADRLEMTEGEDKPGPTDSVLTDIAGLFMTEFSIPGRYTTEGGDIMEFTMPEAFLYVPGSLTVRPDKHPFLDQLVAAVTRVDTGHRQEIIFLFAAGEAQISGELSPSQELASRRAGSLARFLRDKGMEKGLFSTGFAPHDKSKIVVLIQSLPMAGGGSGDA